MSSLGHVDKHTVGDESDNERKESNYDDDGQCSDYGQCSKGNYEVRCLKERIICMVWAKRSGGEVAGKRR